MRKFGTAEKGFSLVEMMIAITIFAVGLLSIAGMQITALRGNSTANTITVNAAVAAGIMEKLLSLPLNHALVTGPISDAVWDFEPSTSGTQNTTSLIGGGTYSATYTVEPDYDSGSGSIENVSRILVRVTQVDGSNRVITMTGFKRSV